MKKVFAGVLCAAMAATMLPTGVFAEEAAQGETYDLMNIPYAEFYAAEINNEIPVDGVSSATMAKAKSTRISGGSYHVNSDGSDITGVTYPVRVADASVLEGLTQITDESSVSVTTVMHGEESTEELTGPQALFEAPTYAYYELSELPKAYKELTVAEDGSFSFGASEAETSELEVTASISTESKYGDYQISVEGLAEDFTPVSGVVLETAEGGQYGLRHKENIWVGAAELAFSVGFKTEEAHGEKLSSDHYAAIQGQTITSIKYYKEDGIYTVNTELYVPFITGVSAEVAEAAAASGETTVTLSADLPEDFQAEYTVEGLADMAVADGKMTFSADAFAGVYKLYVNDASGKYAAVPAEFTLTTDAVAASYNEDAEAPALVAAEGAEDEAFAAFLANLSGCTINGTEYSFGHHGIDLIDEEGAINLDVEGKDGMIFEEAGSYEVVVSANGYTTPAAFTIVIE